MSIAPTRPDDAARPGSSATRALKRVLRPSYVWARRMWVGAVFDRRYAVHTEDHVDLDVLGLNEPGRVSYVPCGRHVLPAVLPRQEVSERDVFLDAGSGMGRVVLQAALRYPARRVIGVEISEDLHRIAERNIESNRHRVRAREVQLVHADILDFEIPDDVTIVFLYNPFKGAILRDFADRLVASVDRSPRRVRVLYVNPEDEASLVAGGRLMLTRKRRLGRWRVHLYEIRTDPAGA